MENRDDYLKPEEGVKKYVAPKVLVRCCMMERGFAGSVIRDTQLIFRDDDHPMEQYNTQDANGETHYFSWE